MTEAGPVVPSHGPRRPLGLRETTLTAGFWADRQAVNAAATLEHCETWMEKLGWLANFDRVADGTIGLGRAGWVFADSEAYKLLEAMAWEHGRTGDPALDERIRRLTARIGRAQDPDGYLGTAFGHAGQPPRYSDLETGHELYNLGHLLQAAVARLRTAGPDDLVAIARRAADHVCERFAAAGLCGHPEIEVGLAEFGRALGEPRYLEQARRFLDRRGHGTLRDIPLGRAYFQDDQPIRAAAAFRGHAVRALYLAAAAVDVAVETDDAELLAAIERQWRHTVARRTHLTGGMGSRHQDEGFGDDWELPPDRAYCETCAGVASVMVAWRLHLATGDVRYADLTERTFYNVIATSPRADGRAFFYANPLHQRVPGVPGDDSAVNPRAEGGSRAAWFDVSCCPTNVARTLASWPAYLATAGDRELTVLQYASARIDTELGGGRFRLDVETRYPDDGDVTIRIEAAPADEVTLRLRVPPWASGASLEANGHQVEARPGTVAVTRRFTAGEILRLRLPVRPRFTWPDPRGDALRGCVAVERGPLVHCAESLDLPASVDLDTVAVDVAAGLTERDGRTVVRARTWSGADAAWPYGPHPRPDPGAAFDLPMVPYHRWAERGPAAMRVWLPAAPDSSGA